MKKEIEVKARVGDREVLLSKMGAIGCELSEPVIQDDSIFVNFDGPFTDYKPGTSFLRLRKSKGKVIFNLKQPQRNELDCIEHETEVVDPEQMRNILKYMGYHEAVRVHKKRQKAKYKEYEICVDEVEGLGSFIEVEKMSDGDGEKVQEELFDFLKSLGVDPKDRVLQGYDTLIYLKNRG